MRLAKDFCAFTEECGVGKKLTTIFINPCFHSVCLFRLSSFLYHIHLSPLSKVVWYVNRLLYHVDLDYRADLAGGFKLVHGLGTVIGCDVCSTGKLTVYQGVTIGGNRGKTRIDESGKFWTQARIGENVTIFTGACVFGPVAISENTVIKARQLVTEDI